MLRELLSADRQWHTLCLPQTRELLTRHTFPPPIFLQKKSTDSTQPSPLHHFLNSLLSSTQFPPHSAQSAPTPWCRCGGSSGYIHHLGVYFCYEAPILLTELIVPATRRHSNDIWAVSYNLNPLFLRSYLPCESGNSQNERGSLSPEERGVEAYKVMELYMCRDNHCG